MPRPKRLRQKAYDYEQEFREQIHPIWLDGVPAGFWEDFQNHRAYMVWLGRQLKFRTYPDWYRVTRADFHQHKGYRLLSYYGNSPSRAVREVFQEFEWLEWKFRRVPQRFWQAASNRRRFLDWLGQELELSCREDWLGVRQDELTRLGGYGLLKFMPFRQVMREYLPNLDWDSQEPPRLSIAQVLAWADAHHDRTGTWPSAKSGRVRDTLEDWRNIDACLQRAMRGLSGGISLAQLLAKNRGAQNRTNTPQLTVDQILRWADQFHRRHGRWPNVNSGVVSNSGGENWRRLDAALRGGVRGLPVSSLARLLAKHRGVRNRCDIPRLTVKAILQWADEHHDRTGNWPRPDSGEIAGSGGETWHGVQSALLNGGRGLRGGDTLRQLLARNGRGKDRVATRLTPRQILKWADTYFRKMGRWPNVNSGPVGGRVDESWKQLDGALRRGLRGLPGDSSLAKLLAEHCGVKNRLNAPLRVSQILKWADAHRRRTGTWPTRTSGPVEGEPGESWMAIDAALCRGHRGLAKDSSLAKLLAEFRGVRNRAALPDLTLEQIRDLARRHFKRTGRWPSRTSRMRSDMSDESWSGIDSALKRGSRGLRARSSLAEVVQSLRRTRPK